MSGSRWDELVVPASIGNLGPGFDTLGLAVSLYLRVRVREIVDDGRGAIACTFLDGAPRGPNGIERAFTDGAPRGGPSIAIEVTSEIPQRAGLGSSAAATIAGLRLRELIEGRRSPSQLLACAARIEKHPDNAAAALVGGFTATCALSDGRLDVSRWPWPAEWQLVVATPAAMLSTEEARRALPPCVPLQHAVFNLQRVTRLLAAVRDVDRDAVADALADRCHQPYREPLVPGLREVLDLTHPDVLGVCLSGAGPSTVAIVDRHVDEVVRVVSGIYDRAGVPCTIRHLTVPQQACREYLGQPVMP